MNSIKEKVKSSKRDFKSRLLDCGYPHELVNKVQAEVDFSSRNNALKYKPKTSKHILSFVSTYNPGVPKLKEILMKRFMCIFPHAPVAANWKEKSL